MLKSTIELATRTGGIELKMCSSGLDVEVSQKIESTNHIHIQQCCIQSYLPYTGRKLREGGRKGLPAR